MSLGVIGALSEKGRPPSLVEIAEALKIRKASVQQLVIALERKGFIEREKGKYRSILLTDKAKSRTRRISTKKAA